MNKVNVPVERTSPGQVLPPDATVGDTILHYIFVGEGNSEGSPVKVGTKKRKSK